MIYDKDADLSKLDGKTVAILGYGSQGHAHALNLKDSGVDVVVGLREDSSSVEKAKADGLRVTSIADAASEGDVVMVLLPDEKQAEVWESEIQDGIAPGNLVMFAHGFSIHFDQIDPGPEVDVGMAAPKGPGHLVRRQYVDGNGVPGLVAIHQDATGSARDMVLAYARGIGCTRAGVIETTFKDETETDLFGEQAVLCGGVTELVRAGLRDPRGRGLRLAARVLRVPARAEADRGPDVREGHQRHALLDLRTPPSTATSRAASGSSASRRATAMKQILGEIQSGDFAREWIAENKAGQENFKRMREEQKDHQIEREGKELRSMMDWIDTEF